MMTQLAGLFAHVAERAIKAGAFVEGGAARVAQKVEDRLAGEETMSDLIRTDDISDDLVNRIHGSLKLLSDSVEADPSRRGGRLVIKGTRFKASQLIAQISEGDSPEVVADDFDLDKHDVKNFLTALSIILDRPFRQ